MSLTDPIACGITVIRNGSRARKESVEVKASIILGKIIEILKKEGFVNDFRFVDDKKQGFYKVYLKYLKSKEPAILGIKKISTPGRRSYLTRDRIKKVYGGLGISIISTSKGVLTDGEARKLNVGGEIICEVW